MNLIRCALYVWKIQNLFGLLPVVDGQMRAVKLAEALKAKVVVPMNNGDLDISESSWAFQVSCSKYSTYIHTHVVCLVLRVLKNGFKACLALNTWKILVGTGER